jgi:microcystin-dependent protein
MDAYIGEIRLMPYNFAPKNWMQCLGQTLSISQNTALFSILGTYYGGNGTTTFELPNFSGTAAIGAGNGGGLSSYSVGETVGQATVALTEATMPAHMHQATGTVTTATPSNTANASGSYLGPGTGEVYGEAAGTGNMAPGSVSGGPTAPAGSGQAHDNMMPFTVLNFCICINGNYPPRS